MVDLARENGREVSNALRRDEFVRSETERFGFLAIGAGEDDDATAHMVRELDGEVAETTNPDDANVVAGRGAKRREGVEDGRSSALQGSGVFAGNGVGDLVDERGFPDGVRGERALVVVGISIDGTFGAEGLMACETLLAF